MKRLVLVMAIAMAVSTLSAPAAAAHARTGRSVEHGEFTTTAAGDELGLQVRGVALLRRAKHRTSALALVKGLDPAVTYTSHLHNAPCDVDGGGDHYQDIVGGPAEPPNELWLSTRGEPAGTIEPTGKGWAVARGRAPWVARAEADAVVIHAPDGTRVACATFD